MNLLNHFFFQVIRSKCIKSHTSILLSDYFNPGSIEREMVQYIHKSVGQMGLNLNILKWTCWPTQTNFNPISGSVSTAQELRQDTICLLNIYQLAVFVRFTHWLNFHDPFLLWSFQFIIHFYCIRKIKHQQIISYLYWKHIFFLCLFSKITRNHLAHFPLDMFILSRTSENVDPLEIFKLVKLNILKLYFHVFLFKNMSTRAIETAAATVWHWIYKFSLFYK